MKRLLTAALIAASSLLPMAQSAQAQLTPLQCDRITLEQSDELVESIVLGGGRIVSGFYFDRDSKLVGGNNVRFLHLVGYASTHMFTVSIRYDCDSHEGTRMVMLRTDGYNTVYEAAEGNSDRYEITEKSFNARVIEPRQLQYGERLY